MYVYANIMYVSLKEVYADTPKKFGEALRLRRLIRGWSQGDLAARTQLSRQAIAGLEQGKPGTQLLTVVKVMNALDVPVLSYVTDDAEEGAHQ